MKIASLFLVLLVAGIVLAGAAVPPFDPFKETAIDAPPGAKVPMGERFSDEDGRSVTLAQIGKGKPILLVPVLHDCPNICEVTLEGLAQAIGAQPFRPGSDFTLVAFGIDARETPASARRSLQHLAKAFPFLAGGGVHGLTGSEAAIRTVTDALGYRFAFNPEINQIAHLSATAVLTADGRLSRWLYGLAPEPTSLRLGLTEAGEGKIGGLTEKFLLLCYHYDPITGRYGTVAWTLLRASGAGTALALATFIGVALLRERRQARRGPERRA